jgi:hypothetical protein
MADYHYACMLSANDEYVRGAPSQEKLYRELAEEREGPLDWAEEVPQFGLTKGQLLDATETVPRILEQAEEALYAGLRSRVGLNVRDW